MTRIPTSARLTVESFTFLHAAKLPALILGIQIPYDHLCNELRSAALPRFAGERQWNCIVHECGAGKSLQRFWIGTKLTPTVVATEGIAQISRRWKHSGLGGPETTLTQLRHYNDDLKRYLGAECDESYGLAAEGHYTFDLRHLRRLTDDKTLPEDLDTLVKWRSGIERANMAGKWKAVVLTE